MFEYADYVYLHIFREKRRYKVGKSSRDGDVFVEFVSPQFDAAERWFVMRMGEICRRYRGLRMIKLPRSLSDVRAGYRVRRLEGAWSTLVRSDGTEVPVAVLGTVTERHSNIAEYSHIADLPVGELAKSYMDPAGAPLLSDYVRR
ncbi:Imm61 family immunity protein [Buchananella felis]|uniref:Imm61 family immunity protein n=1 Tax=Buchananella felis TaxID=3231492 RepID=UPI003527EA1E